METSEPQETPVEISGPLFHLSRVFLKKKLGLSKNSDNSRKTQESREKLRIVKNCTEMVRKKVFDFFLSYVF